MRSTRVRTTFIAAALTALGLPLAGCNQADGDDGIDSTESAQRSGSDAWGPSLALRDDTGTFANRPEGGWYVTPIHTTLLPSGKVLITGWERAQQDRCVFPEGSRSHGSSFVLDPTVLAAQKSPGLIDISPLGEQLEQTEGWTPDVLYCAGHVPTKNGVLYTGGARYQDLGVSGQEAEVGITSARMFDYGTGAFRLLTSRMQGGPVAEAIKSRPQLGPVDKRGWRWYPTNTRMSDGRVLVTGGFSSLESANQAVEIYDPSNETFSMLVQHDDAAPALREAMAPGLKDYTHTILLPEPVPAASAGGRARQIAMVGWSGRVLLMNTDPGVPASERFALRPNSARPGVNGGTGATWDSTAALVSTGELLTLGGTNDPGLARRADFYNPITDAWSQVDMGIGRRNAATVLLPDGNVLVMGGWNEDGNLPGDRRMPQVLDPRTKEVTTYPAWPDDPYERGYHSFAMLLKDGSVLVGGGISPKVSGVEISSIGCERNDVRIYKPGYLTKGPRPVIDAAEPLDLEIGAGAETSVPFGGAALAKSGGAVLMALGSTTHSFDQNQRYVPLPYRVTGATVAIKAPADPVRAPEGDYLLFLVSSTGTPSVGKHVRLRRTASPVSASPVSAMSEVTFKVDNYTTTPGTDMYVSGDAPELGQWNVAKAVPLTATAYPTWTGTVKLPRNKSATFKFIKKDSKGKVTWESGANRTFAVPNAATATFKGTWR